MEGSEKGWKDQMKIGIYAIQCIPNGKLYLGSTVNRKARWAHHRNRLRKNLHHCVYLQNAWNKYGASAFAWLWLEDVTAQCVDAKPSEVSELLFQREQWWYDKYSSSKCFNARPFVRSNLGVKYSDEAKHKMGAWQLGKKHSAETRARIAAARKGQPSHNKGKTFSAEVRARMSAGGKGKVLTPEHRAKIAAAGRKAWKERRVLH